MEAPRDLAAQAEFYQSHLNRVSRSFAFCIERLEGPLRNWVGLSYLLCRVLDTVEDAPWKNSKQQSEHFSKFLRFLHKTPETREVREWREAFPQEIPEGERELLQHADTLFRDYHSLPQKIRQSLATSIQNMGRGMAYFCARKVDGALKLRGLREVNQYCFFVAGVVGELLTKLVVTAAPEGWTIPREIFVNAHRFGLFLQKVNLLKDQTIDEGEGRFLIPSRPEVLQSLEHDARGAVQYLLDLPVSLRSYRLFCAWSLFLGLRSLPWIERAFEERSGIKIPRDKTQELLAMVEAVIDDNESLCALFEQLLPPIDAPSGWSAREQGLSEGWFEELYQGELSKEELQSLGLLSAQAP
jgi:phytoene/squalene synthetase